MTAAASVAEDVVDVKLSMDPGTIKRPMGQNCRHPPRSKCCHCLDLDPFDAAYLASKELKHMSFHAYRKKVTNSIAKGRSSVLSYPLENAVCRVKECKHHAPYPAAICSKCQPDPIILARQEYRHVDNVAFENEVVVDKFLDFWRKGGGAQRVGILLGRYEPHTDVPLGIRASVSAIFEPPQLSTKDKVVVEGLMYAEEEGAWLKEVEEICEGLDIRVLGWIFTDLIQLEDGKFLYSRNPLTSYLVSAQECITAAFLQNRYPNICKLAHEGHFGSKFVTVCVSGGSDGGMEFRGYQMSNQASALVKDEWLVPTAGLPDKAYVRDDKKTSGWSPLPASPTRPTSGTTKSASPTSSSRLALSSRDEALVKDEWLVPTAGLPDKAYVRDDKKCVPDVKFSEKDQYGNNVARDARPFPVEYLLVDVPAGLSSSPTHSFNPLPHKPRFPITNRDQIGELQNMGALSGYMEKFEEAEALFAFTDYHLLYFIRHNPTCHVPKEGMEPLLKAIREGSAEGVSAWTSTCPDWATLQHLATTEKGAEQGGAAGGSAAAGAGGGEWPCKHCTFANPAAATDCQICGLPK